MSPTHSTLKLTGSTRTFVGLGRAVGVLAEPVPVSLGRVTTNIAFYVVEEFPLPPLIGIDDLAKFRMIMDPMSRPLVDKFSGALVASVSETLTPAKRRQPGTTSDIDQY